MTDGSEEQRRLAADVLSYFVGHPKALDSLEGVSRWRLLESRVRSTVESTQLVLDSLVEQGYLMRIETKSGPLFRINADKLSAVESFLRESKPNRNEP